MPTYEYVCQKCGHEYEQFQSMKDEPLRKCPKCKRLSLKRLVGGGAGLIFKGSGFYITDYKKSAASASDSGAAKKPAADAAPKAKPAEAPAEAPAKAKPADTAKK